MGFGLGFGSQLPPDDEPSSVWAPQIGHAAWTGIFKRSELKYMDWKDVSGY